MADINLNITINAKPEEVYKALTEEKRLKKWWTTDCSAKPEEGSSTRFNFKKDNFYNIMQIVSLKPNRIEWKCIEAGNESNREWEGTRVIWEIQGDGETRIKMTHKDWKGESELYKRCADGWAYYVGESLKEYLETGTGKPYS